MLYINQTTPQGYFHIMTATSFFLLGSIMGALLFVEGTVLRNNEGRLNKIVYVISTLEFLWLLICIYALFTIDFPGWTILLPAAYISYFIVATRNYHSLTSGLETVEDFKSLTMPASIIKIEIYAGIGYMILNLLAWFQFSGAG